MSAMPVNLNEPAQDMYARLIDDGYCDNAERVSGLCCSGASDRHALDSFLYDHCFYDFIWIEKNINAHNFLIESFEQSVMSHGLENTIPIVTLYYRT